MKEFRRITFEQPWEEYVLNQFIDETLELDGIDSETERIEREKRHVNNLIKYSR